MLDNTAATPEKAQPGNLRRGVFTALHKHLLISAGKVKIHSLDSSFWYFQKVLFPLQVAPVAYTHRRNYWRSNFDLLKSRFTSCSRTQRNNLSHELIWKLSRSNTDTLHKLSCPSISHLDSGKICKLVAFASCFPLCNTDKMPPSENHYTVSSIIILLRRHKPKHRGWSAFIYFRALFSTPKCLWNTYKIYSPTPTIYIYV